MSKQSFTTSMNPEIVIGQIAGDLQVKGWDQAEVIVNAEPDDLKIEQLDDKIRLDCEGDCLMRVPQGASVQVEKVEGDAVFKFLDGDLTAGVVHGSMEVRQAAGVQVETVHGHLAARRLSGDLKAKNVYGHAELRDLEGGCWLEQAAGNLDLRDVEGEIHAQTHGNARVRLSSMSGEQYSIQADANVHCHIPEEVSLKLEITSGAQLIRLKLPDGTQNLRQEKAELSLGEGQASMKLVAGATVSLLSQQADWLEMDSEFGGRHIHLPDDFGVTIAKEVESQIQAQLEGMNQQINEQMARLSVQIGRAGVSEEEKERILERSRQASERATARAQEKMRRAQEKLERKLEAAQRRQETPSRGRRSWGADFSFSSTPPTPPTTPAAPVSEEERMMILRMLEQKKISLEEADRLLAALEGKEKE
jgi:hypothetical protein